MEQVRLTATTGFGLEAVVGRELQRLGYENQSRSDGRVTFDAPIEAIARCNLQLRAADRLLLQIGQFPAGDFDAYFDQIQQLPWERWIPADASFPVTGSSRKSVLKSVPTCQGMAKKAIANRLQSVYRCSLEENGPACAVQFEIRNDLCTISLDTSGEGLHKRGYRLRRGVAPLRETLAASLVQLSVWNRERVFHDPFCGSGTIAIEAALIAQNQAPGLNRHFACEEWPTYPRALWEQARTEARDMIDHSESSPILATDNNYHVLNAARENAARAGVEQRIHFQQLDVSTLTTQRKYGCLVTNPPYGERIDDATEAHKLWVNIAELSERWPTWSMFVLAGSREFEKIFGRKATRRRKLYNGPIECTYYQYLGPKPPRVSVRPDEP